MTAHDRTSFEGLYTGQPRREIGRPQKALLEVADQISGVILDSGCGTGENALFFAKRGHKVTGIDFLPEPISIANQKATERGLTATFLVMDALTLKDLPEVFDTVIDTCRNPTYVKTSAEAIQSKPKCNTVLSAIQNSTTDQIRKTLTMCQHACIAPFTGVASSAANIGASASSPPIRT